MPDVNRFLRRDHAPTSRRFVAWLVGCTLLLDTLMLGSTDLALEQSRSGHEQRAATAARNLAALLERDMQATIQKIDLALLAVSDETARAPRRSDGRAFDSFVDRQESRLTEVGLLATTDAGGSVEGANRRKATGVATLAERPDFGRLASDGRVGLIVSSPLAARFTGVPALMFARSLRTATGAFDGIVFATLELRRFDDLFSAVEVGPHGLVVLRDEALRVIARYPADDAPGQAPATAHPDRLLAGQQTGQTPARAGRPRSTASSAPEDDRRRRRGRDDPRPVGRVRLR